MLRKSLVLIFVICVTSVSYGLVIGDFENDLDGWQIWDYDGRQDERSLEFSSTGATLNDNSLKVIIESPAQAWGQVIKLQMAGNQELIDAYRNSTTVSMDVTYDPVDWEGDGAWANFKIIINSQNGGWQDQGPPETDTVNPDSPSAWDPVNFTTLQTRTVTWDIRDTQAGIANGPGGWFELVFETQFDLDFPRGVYYLDNVQLLGTPEASDPMPANEANDVDVLPILSWTVGSRAASHTLYFGTDYNDVNDATPESHDNVMMVNLTESRYMLQDYLAFESISHWRVDEVNDTDVWKGPVWTFTTGTFETIDNFETYLNTAIKGNNRIFETWHDGIGFTDAENNMIPGNGTGMTVGVDDFPYGPERTTVNSGVQSLPLTYNNENAPFYSEATRAFASPQDWTTAHDGQLFDSLSLHIHGRWESPGTFSYDQATGQYTVVGSGVDIYLAKDEFHYVFQPLPGDGSIVAKVESVENTHEWAKAGVMIREGLAPDAAMFSVNAAPSQRVEFLYRDIPGEDAVQADDTGAGSIVFPYWIKVSRQGGTFTAQHSADGQTWEDFSQGSLVLPLFGDVYIGLVVTSHVDAGTPCEAVFSEVTVTGTANPVFTESTDVLGMPTNVGDNLYVSVEDNNGGFVTINHPDDPNTVLVNNWQQWRLGLADLSDQGVDLTRITSMTLGIGNKDNPTPRGMGKIFVDDIRLYLASPNEPNGL